MTEYYRKAQRKWPGGVRISPSGSVFNQSPAQLGTFCGSMSSTHQMGGPPYHADHPWDAKDQYAVCGRCEARTAQGAYVNWRLGLFTYTEGSVGIGYTFPTVAFDQNYWRTKALASLAPQQTTVDVSLFIYELREIPRMLFDAYRVLRGQAVVSDLIGQQLAAHYGWAPLYSDIKTLTELGILIKEGVKTSGRESIRQGGSLGSWTEYGSLSGLSGIGSSTHSLDLELRTKVWYQAKWKPKGDLPPLETAGFDRWVDQVSKLTPGYSTVWNGLPWSFVVDYFLNVGDIVEAYAGIEYEPDTLLIMGTTNVRSVKYYPPSVNGTLVVSSNPSYKGRHRRRFLFPHPSIQLGVRPAPWTTKGGLLSLLAVAQIMR